MNLWHVSFLLMCDGKKKERDESLWLRPSRSIYETTNLLWITYKYIYYIYGDVLLDGSAKLGRTEGIEI